MVALFRQHLDNKSKFKHFNSKRSFKKIYYNNDELLVVCLTGEGAWTGFSDECSNWLKNNL